MLNHELNIQCNQEKLYRLKSKRVINAGQWDILYPSMGAVVSSTKFDISLMSFVLREIGGINAPITGWDIMPGGGDQSEGADIVRMRMYRNDIAHNNDGIMSNVDFQKTSTDLKQAIIRLGGQNLEAEIDRVLTCSIDETDSDLWREVRIELQQMKNEVDLKEISPGQLMSWKEDDETFSPTKATAYIYREAERKQKLLLVGFPGAGKSANVHHVALRLKDKGYRVFCMQRVKKMVEVIDKLGEDKQVYIFDDVFGVHGVVEDKRRDWSDENKDNLERCLKKPNVIILCTSRLTVILDDKLSNIKSHFTIINLSQGDNELSDDERVEIFRKHAIAKQRNDLLKDKDELKNKVEQEIRETECPVGCFPLVCRLYTGDRETKHTKQTIKEYFSKPLKVITDVINNLRIEEPLRHFCLLLCLMYENKLPVSIITVREESERTKKLRKELLELCKLPASTSREEIRAKMNTLLQTFVKFEGDAYHFVHVMIQDVVIQHVINLSSNGLRDSLPI